jgi:hypothetical protein
MIYIVMKCAKKCYLCTRRIEKGEKAVLVVTPYYARREGVSSKKKVKHRACGAMHPFLEMLPKLPKTGGLS